MKWKKPQESKLMIYAPGIKPGEGFVQGFILKDRLETHCRAFLFVDKRTNESEMGLPAAEIREKAKQLQGRLPGVILSTERLDVHDEGIIQLVLHELDNVESSLQQALQHVAGQSKGVVIGLYRTKGGVGIHTLAKLLHLHLKENHLSSHVISREERFGFEVTNANQMPGKVEQARGTADTVIVCDPTPATQVDRRIFVADQTDVSVRKIQEERKTFDCVVINRFNKEIIPKNVFEKAVGIEEMLYIDEISDIRIAGMMGSIDEVPTSIRADLQAMYM